MGKISGALAKARRAQARLDRHRANSRGGAVPSHAAHCPLCRAPFVHWGCQHCDRWTALSVVGIAAFMLVVGLIVGICISALVAVWAS